MHRFNRGDLVETWFDDGMGGCPLYGKVVAAGPVAARVMWESRQSNRIKQDAHNVKPARDQAGARAAIAKATQ